MKPRCMDDCCIVLNPAAGAVLRQEVAPQLSRVAKKAAVVLTGGPGDAERAARRAVEEGFKTVVAAGGDGTVNEVLRGVAGSAARLGVLPLGTMNVFARELGLPLDWEEALAQIVKGSETRIDLVWANGQPMAQLGGVGFDARALARVDPAVKKAFGPVAYVLAGIQEISRPQALFRICAYGMGEMEGVWVLVGTGRFYAGPFAAFPNANSRDGLLDVLVVRDLSVLKMLRSLLLVPFGLHPSADGLTYFQTERLRVEPVLACETREFGGGEVVGYELDGEWRGSAPVEFWVEKSALAVVV